MLASFRRDLLNVLGMSCLVALVGCASVNGPSPLSQRTTLSNILQRNGNDTNAMAANGGAQPVASGVQQASYEQPRVAGRGAPPKSSCGTPFG